LFSDIAAEGDAFAAPSVSASIGSSATGQAQNVTVSAESDDGAQSNAAGATIGLTLAVGKSIAVAKVSPKVSANVGSGAHVNAGQPLTVEALHQTTGAVATAEANGGGLADSNGAGASAVADANVDSSASPGASLTAGGAVTIQAVSANDAHATGQGFSI